MRESLISPAILLSTFSKILTISFSGKSPVFNPYSYVPHSNIFLPSNSGLPVCTGENYTMPNYEKQSPFYAHHVRFINSCTINCIQDNLQLSCFCGLTDTGFSSSSWYSYIPGKHAGDMAFARIPLHQPTQRHIKPICHKKKAFLQHTGLNAGGAKVHPSCKNIQPGHVKPAVCWQNFRKILVNWKLCCTTITITLSGKWLAE